MIRHQAEAEDLERMLGFGRGKQLQEGRIVGLLVKDSGPTIATVQHMVGVPGDLSTRNTRHRAYTIREWGGETQEKVACPLLLFKRLPAFVAYRLLRRSRLGEVGAGRGAPLFPGGP